MEAEALFASFFISLRTACSPLMGLQRGMAAYLAFAPQTGLRHYLRAMLNDPFAKLPHPWNWFDAAMLLPYFAVMIALSVYGIHRYTMCYRYFKYSKNYNPNPPRHFEELPQVTIQLPIFNEQFVIDRLIEAVCAMEYPREKLEIQVLDDSTDETQEVARGIVDRYAALGVPIVYIHRTNRHGFKAGALDAGLKVAKGEFIAIFDADFVPPADWIMKVIHHFAEPEIGMVQTRWAHLNRNYSMLTEIEAILLDGHFVLEHGARSPLRRVLQLQRHRRHVAAPGHLRRRRLAARHAHRRHRPQLPLANGRLEVQVPARCRVPVRAAHRDDGLQNPAGALGQGAHPDQHQNPAQVFRSNTSRRNKIESVYHLTANLSYPLMIVMSALLIPAMICRFYQGWFQMLLIDFPLFTASSFSIAVFYLMSERELFPKTWKRTFYYLPFLMAIGIGLTVTNTKAVMEALLGIKSAFVRTPKYRVAQKGEKSQAAKYRKRLKLAPWIELLLGCYFAAAIYYTFTNNNYFTAPFLILFVVGYWYTGLMSLLQGRFERWRTGVDTDESSPKPFPVGV